MGELRRNGYRSRQLSWKTNRAGESARTSVQRNEPESVLRAHAVAEPSGTERARDRLRKRTRFEMAARALGRNLHLPGRAAGHDRRARFKLSAFVHHSVHERADLASGDEC